MVGDTIYIMFTEVYDDGSTVRESVQAFEKEEAAKNELKLFAAEQDEWIEKEHPNWTREQGSETFYEAYEKDAYYASHAIAKVIKTVVM